MSPSDSGKWDLIDRLADEFAQRYRQGERPSLTEYTDRYPALASRRKRSSIWAFVET